MSESVILLLGLLMISCPLSALLGGIVVAVTFRAFAERGKENGNGNAAHKRIRTFVVPKIPNSEIYHSVKRWAEDGWDYKIIDAKTVGESDIILSKYL